MQAKRIDLIRQLPIRIRVGMMLALCERVLPMLAGNEGAISIATASLEDGWKWVAGGVVSARAIYGRFEELAGCETSAKIEKEVNTICSIELTIQYVSWHAFRIELKGVPPQTQPVPNDLADVTEDYVGEIISFATRVRPEVLRWIDDILAGHRFDISPASADELGPPALKRDFCL